MIVRKIPRHFASRNDTKHISYRGAINQKGFTLLEIIVSIVVISIIAVIAGVGLIEITKGYLFSKKNAVTTQQGQIAMARLKKEFSNMYSVSAATATSITLTRSSDSPPRPSYTISWAGINSPLLIDGDTLVDPVTSFNLTYCASYNSCSSPSSYSNSTSIIEITLQLKGAEDSPMNLVDRVNLYLETGG